MRVSVLVAAISVFSAIGCVSIDDDSESFVTQRAAIEEEAEYYVDSDGSIMLEYPAPASSDDSAFCEAVCAPLQGEDERCDGRDDGCAGLVDSGRSRSDRVCYCGECTVRCVDGHCYGPRACNPE